MILFLCFLLYVLYTHKYRQEIEIVRNSQRVQRIREILATYILLVFVHNNGINLCLRNDEFSVASDR